MTVHAYAIVRLDYSGSQADAHVAGLEALAASRGVELAAGGVLLAQSDSSFCQLLAGLDFEAVDVVMVPSAAQIKGWLGVLRCSAEVWTAIPRQCWPRCGAIPSQDCRIRSQTDVAGTGVVAMSQCHLTVCFYGGPVLHFCGEECAALAFARAAYIQHSAMVTIDHNLTPGLKPFPCQRLWMP